MTRCPFRDSLNHISSIKTPPQDFVPKRHPRHNPYGVNDVAELWELLNGLRNAQGTPVRALGRLTPVTHHYWERLLYGVPGANRNIRIRRLMELLAAIRCQLWVVPLGWDGRPDFRVKPLPKKQTKRRQ